MKTKSFSALFLFAATPIFLAASPAQDRKIEEVAQASYNYRTVLEDRVKAAASNGVVTLTGTVHDRDDAALAKDTVENLPGVTRVQNDIKVTPTLREHSDAWIAFKIRGQLLVKGSVSAATTTVAVEDGIVTLGGTAENAAQKELTGTCAREIEGVKAVRNSIAVKNQPATIAPVADTMDDASITSQVKYALMRHKSTRGLRTGIATSDGRIIITGEAGSAAEKSLVTRLATDVRGVKSVSNGMTVKGGSATGFFSSITTKKS